MTEAIEGAAPEVVTEDVTLAPEVAEVVETIADEAGADAETEAEAPKPKPKKTAQERFDELTREKHEAKREADYWREQAMRTAPAQAAPQPKADDEPNPADFTYGETDVEYIRAQARHEARKVAREEMANEREQSRVQAGIQTFQQRVAQQYPDGEPAGIANIRRLPSLPQGIADPILSSEIGPKLADHLGSNSAELNRLIALPAHLQAYEVGKLEARLTTAKPQAKTTTTAPEPIPQVRGTGGQFKPAPDTDDFAAFEKAYSK